MLEDLIIYRGLERVFALLVGGVSIWCGFKLFHAAPDKKPDGQVEVSIAKDKRLLFTRIGPGTFFSLFGTAVVLASFIYPVSLETAEGSFSGAAQRGGGGAIFTPTGSGTGQISQTKTAVSLEFIRELEASAPSAGTPEDIAWAKRRFQDLKLAVMAGNWNTDWGDFQDFNIWLNSPAPRTRNPQFEDALEFLSGGE